MDYFNNSIVAGVDDRVGLLAIWKLKNTQHHAWTAMLQ